MERASKYGRALDTTDKLRAFLDALKSGLTGSNRSNLSRRNRLFADVGGSVTPGLMQYLDLLEAAYDRRRGRPQGFCRAVCGTMVGWAEAEERNGLEHEELEAEMFSKWGKSGKGFSLVPEALQDAMRPEYKAAMEYAADYLLSDSGSSALSSGLRVAKVLTGVYAIQDLDEDLADVMVEDLSSLDLPDGWRNYLRESRAETEMTDTAPAAGAPAARRVPARARGWPASAVFDVGGSSADDRITCPDCGKGFASRHSLANHKRVHDSWLAKDVGSSSRGQKSGASAVDVDSDDDRTVRRVLEKKAKFGSSRGDPAREKASPKNDVAADVAQALKAMLAKEIKAGARLLTEEV
ncbi:hypothetical protein KFL_002230040 [Klebsormidium nitens]|uniref:C2H2-type domain-containing protein n=1 Tax=Klebsormidium nitens TaxID=105231 RepID=A0A1Y1I2P1_KLENI|nr:hypothetical protein KFL_002230040 [Klebsormidium nitens]|eukprot:GAQ85184.1 hypothetical protein KFL_002230040 [Klebsormidium nitens]